MAALGQAGGDPGLLAEASDEKTSQTLTLTKTTADDTAAMTMIQ